MNFDEYLEEELEKDAELRKEYESLQGEWVLAEDDFDDGNGNRVYPHCSKCYKGVYRHDAGGWCPFCGTVMSNPLV